MATIQSIYHFLNIYDIINRALNPKVIHYKQNMEVQYQPSSVAWIWCKIISPKAYIVIKDFMRRWIYCSIYVFAVNNSQN